MPITVKNMPNFPVNSTTTIGGVDAAIRADLRTALNLPQTVVIQVGMSKSTLDFGGIFVTVPVGVVQYQKNDASYGDAIERVKSFLSTTAMATPVPSEAGVALKADTGDEVWMVNTAKKLFPVVIPLHKATEMHQRVLGTTVSSVYRVCFIGPNLLGACRVKANGVSFRFTTPSAKAPEGVVLDMLQRLGVTQVYHDRVTSHATFNEISDVQGVHPDLRIVMGAFYAGLRPFITSPFPNLTLMSEAVE